MLLIERSTCTGCAACVDVCPVGAIALDEREGVATLNQVQCRECLACLEICPTGAIQQVTSSELVFAGQRQIASEQVVEGEVIAARPSGRLMTLTDAALTFLGQWLLPRAADALVGAVEQRLARRIHPALSGSSLNAENHPSLPRPGQRKQCPDNQRRRHRHGRR